MKKGIIEYDKSGKPICHICGKAFDRVTTHARQVHGISAREYKLKFGLDLKKGICSINSKNKSSKAVFCNYEKCINSNLLEKGKNNRFVNGCKGRTKEKVSEETRIRLKQRLKTPEMIKAMQKSGEKVGKSGLGNKVRWKK